MENRPRLSSSDYYFFGVIIVCGAVVVRDWKKFESCNQPMHIWLMVDFAAMLLFRLLIYLSQLVRFRRDQRRRLLEVALVSAYVFVVFPFLIAWNIVGTLWFSRIDSSCLRDRSQFWAVSIWILFVYLYLFSCVLVLLWNLRLSIRLRRVNRVLNILQELERLHMAAMQPPTGQGLSPLQIQSLPLETVQAPVAESLSTCAICFEDIVAGQVVRRLPCVHLFHTDCIDRWLAQKAVCPTCSCNALGAVQSHPNPLDVEAPPPPLPHARPLADFEQGYQQPRGGALYQ